MKADKFILCAVYAVLYFIDHSSATSKRLPDSDISALKNSIGNNIDPAFKYGWGTTDEYKHNNRQRTVKEKFAKSIIPKTYKNLRRRMLKSKPLMRNLNHEQILPLSTLLHQVNSKSDPKSIFRKLRHNFDKDIFLISSLAYDISNTVPKSEQEHNQSEDNIFSIESHKAQINISRQSAELTSNDFPMENENIGVDQQIIDPKKMGSLVPKKNTKIMRYKRSAAKLIHKLIRIPPPNITEEPTPNENVPFEIKLNTSSFESPYYDTDSESDDLDNMTLTYEQIEDLALADLNGTEIELHGNYTSEEELPNPEELVSVPRYRISNKHRVNFVKGESKRKRLPVWSHQIPILQKKCERFTASMCIKADDYPLDLIMGSIRRHKNAMSALLAEYHDKAAELEYQEQLEEYQFNGKRREDGNVITPGGMCSSIVRYARPQKARSASGEWKYIVNTGRHTQTLRLEKCSTPQESCSYLSHNYRSRCTQVYNYHRLLSWDKTRGLHVDIFKVPTCCSCQVDGYRETFPPLGGSKHNEFKDYTPVPNNNPYSINDEIDYEDEDDDDGANAFQYGNGLQKAKHNTFQHSELLLGSTNIKTKVSPPRINPTVGSYLSPPSDKYDSQVISKNVRPSYYRHSNTLHNARSRKPYKNYIPNESRVDLEISGTEQTNKEVKTYSITDNSRVPQKRTRLFSGLPQKPLETVPSIEATTRITHISTSPSAGTIKDISNGKRINYNYHPIIDFFESHQKPGKDQQLVRNTAINSIPISSEIITSRDSRIGYGMSNLENSWHPVVLNS